MARQGNIPTDSFVHSKTLLVSLNSCAHKELSTMIASRVLSRAAPRAKAMSQQRRGFLDYLTNYPDKVMEKKVLQTKGGTCLGENNPTWTKQGTSDQITNYIGLFLVVTGFAQLAQGHYRLATGKGKME